MKTLAEIYCTEHRCAAARFDRRLFWRCLHRSALPIAPLALWLWPDRFQPDWELIRSAARCSSLRELDEEIRDFTTNSANQHWWRRVARLRLSTRRVRQVARLHLPASDRSPLRPSGVTTS